MAGGKETSDFDPARPFLCPECGSRYTRQEHLDRHVTAKHRVAKDFVCPVCHKGFARKDILKRHQAGHEKQQQAAHEAAMRGDLLDDDDRRSVGSSASKKKKRPVAQQNNDAADESGGPVKIARVGRACCRCSKSKLRCDGQNPCERCRKAGIECSFDRPAKGPPSRSGSVSMQMPDELQYTPPMDSDSSTTSPENAFNLPALPTPPPNDQWGRQLSAAVQQASMSLYNMPLRHSSPHHALPPNSFIQGQPAPVNYYSGRPAESFAYGRNTSPYHQPVPNYASMNLPHHAPSPLNPYAQPSNLLPAAAAASSSSQWDNSAFGRQIGEAENNHLDFFGLVAGNGAVEDGIDWSILSGGFSQNDPVLNNVTGSVRSGFTPRDGMSPAPSAGGNVDLSVLTSALTAPAQPVSDLRNGVTADDDDDEDEEPVASTSRLPFEADESAIDDEEGDDLPEPPVPHRTNSIVDSDRAAFSLLQLASHTPRVSPEPQAPASSSATKPNFPRGHFAVLNPSSEEALRSSHPRDSPSATDPWPLSYRPTEPNEDILPASARGTGYFSRAASPPPHHPHIPLSHVPSITDATRLRILYKVRELSAVDSSLSERFVPRLELLELFLQLYFDRYHPLFPLVHKPTWDPNTAPSFLVLAIASVGARYAHERVVGASMHAHALLESARRMAQVMGDADMTLLRTVAWQQCLLIVLQSGIFSGNKRDLERTQAYASMPVTFARRQNWLREPQVDESAEELLPLDERWKRWRNREEIRRLGFGALVFDCAGTALWNIESLSLYLDAANTALPCHDSLWDASTSTTWAALFPSSNSVLPPPSLTLSRAIQLVCASSVTASAALAPILRDSFALTTVLSVLNALEWARGHAKTVEKTFLTPAPPAPFAGVKVEPVVNGKDSELGVEDKALEAGLNFFLDKVLAVDPQQQNSTGNTMALLIHLTALNQYLPLRVLQPLARTTLAPLPPSTLSALRTWAAASNGAVARTTAYHAGQLLALCRTSPNSLSSTTAGEGPLEPFATFYAALALIAFVRESGATFDLKAEEGKQELQLDILRPRSEMALQAWIHSGPLASSASSTVVPTLHLFPSLSSSRTSAHLDSPSSPTSTSTTPLRLTSPRASELLLSALSTHLSTQVNKVWKVGENLGSVLEGLATAERMKRDEIEGAVLGKLTREGSSVRSTSADGRSTAGAGAGAVKAEAGDEVTMAGV